MKTEDTETTKKIAETTTPTWLSEKVEQLKAQNNLKEVFVVSATDDDGNLLYCFLKKPNRTVISYAQSLLTTDPVRSDEVLLLGCWLEGDMRFQTDDDFFFAVTPTLRTIVSYKTAQLKKF